MVVVVKKEEARSPDGQAPHQIRVSRGTEGHSSQSLAGSKGYEEKTRQRYSNARLLLYSPCGGFP